MKKQIYIILILLNLLITNIYAANIFTNKNYKNISYIEFQNLADFKQTNISSQIGYEFNPKLKTSLVLSSSDAEFITLINKYEFANKLGFGIVVEGIAYSFNNFNFLYNVNMFSTSFDELSDIYSNKYKLKQSIFELKLKSEYEFNDKLTSNISIGYLQNKLKLSSNVENISNTNKDAISIGLGITYNMMDNISFDLTSSLIAEKSIEIGVNYTFNKHKRTVKEAKEQSKTESKPMYYICPNGHKFEKEYKFCLTCGQLLKKESDEVIEKSYKIIKACSNCDMIPKDNANFCVDCGSKIVSKQIITEPEYKWIDSEGNVYYSEQDIPSGIQPIRYPINQKVLVGYQSTGTGKIFQEKISFCPDTGKKVVELYR
jgi:opacity protein-like surface antigen/RNA polymerase subunit RPABC4/transcription elongation factor Spt4